MGSKDSRAKAQAPLEIKLLDFLYGEWGVTSFCFRQESLEDSHFDLHMSVFNPDASLSDH